jgi:glycosyltransferase involved in cell wall biosynthesis
MGLEKNKVLVIMPCYNAQNTIYRAIDTAINQTYKNFTLVCYDDKSTDKTLDILIKLKEKLNFKLIIGKNNLGTGDAINTAIKESTDFEEYDYITWISADNITTNTFIEKHVENLNNGNSISYSGWKILNSNEVFIPETNLKHLRDNFQLGPSFMFTSKLYDIAGPFNCLPGEDYYFSVKCALSNAKFGYINDILMEYRVHDNSVTSKIANFSITKLCSGKAIKLASDIDIDNGTKIYRY